MFEQVLIKNFRNFRQISLDGLSTLNLITGRNGTGKTSVLEALFLNASACSPAMVLPLSIARNEQVDSLANDAYARNYFYEFQTKQPASIHAKWKDGRDGDSYTRDLLIRAITATPMPTLQTGINQLVTGLEFEFLGGTKSVPDGKIQSKSAIQWVEVPALSQAPFPGQPISGGSMSGTNSTGWPSSSLGTALISQNLFGVPVQSQPARQRAFRLEIGNVDNPLLIPALMVQARAFGAAAEIYKAVVTATKNKRVDNIVRMMSCIEPRVKDIVPLNDRGADSVYVDIGERDLRPLNIMGAGFFNALNIASAISAEELRIILIDELEDGIHYLAFKDIARFLVRNLVGRDLQIFITTHSDEMISAFAAVALEEEFRDICALRLSRGSHDIGVTRFGDDDLVASREIDLELR